MGSPEPLAVIMNISLMSMNITIYSVNAYIPLELDVEGFMKRDLQLISKRNIYPHHPHCRQTNALNIGSGISDNYDLSVSIPLCLSVSVSVSTFVPFSQ